MVDLKAPSATENLWTSAPLGTEPEPAQVVSAHTWFEARALLGYPETGVREYKQAKEETK